MTRLFITLVLVFLTCQHVFGQVGNVFPSSYQQEKAWLDSLKELPQEQQLLVLKNRLLLDTLASRRADLSQATIMPIDTAYTHLVSQVKPDKYYYQGRSLLIIGGIAFAINQETTIKQRKVLINTFHQSI